MEYAPQFEQCLLQTCSRLAAKGIQEFSENALLYTVLLCHDPLLDAFFEYKGVDANQLLLEIESFLYKQAVAPVVADEEISNPSISWTDRARRVQARAAVYTLLSGAVQIGAVHVLMSLLKEESLFSIDFLMSKDIDIPTLKSFYFSYSQNKPKHQQTVVDGLEQEDFDFPDRGNPSNDPNAGEKESSSKNSGSKTTVQEPSSQTPALDAFGVDITRMAAEGKLDPMIGRNGEIERLIQILCRRKKNNPVLIGEPGVGKSAIVEGLAQRIVDRKVNRILFDKRIISLDLALMVAGAKYRGQFEERLKTLMQEVKKDKNIILFLDELHTIVGAGSAEGSMDTANMIKPALARGEMQCIGATTLDEYRKSIESDGALERRFQKIVVPPSTKEETLDILSQLKSRYEEFHHVHYTPEAIRAAVELTDRYVSDRFFPDKAIDVIDEAGAGVHVKTVNASPELEFLEKRLSEIQEQKKVAVKAQNYELAASFRDKERNVENEISIAKKAWVDSLNQHKEEVSEGDIARVVALMTGVPTERIAIVENERLRSMGNELKNRVIGQDKAIDKVVKAIQRNRLGLRNERRPIGSFMFIGSTGVGKTFLAKKLAEQLFDDEGAIIRVDMSEYMEKFSVSRLLGAPPGYVGYEEGGQLTEQIRRKPYSVVLLDEIEKAHPDVYNILLQVLDEGALTDSYGRKVDFKNTVIIITSNVGTRKLKDFGHGLGYRTERELTTEEAQDVLLKELKKQFSPEFLNRLDDILVFEQLNRGEIRKIVDLELKPLLMRIEKQGYHLVVTEAAKELLMEKGYDPQYGARPLRRALQQEVEDRLTDLILDGEVRVGDVVKLRSVNGNFKMTVEKGSNTIENNN